MSSKHEFGDITFDLPKNQSNVIKVIGVGGGGSNAINHMFQQGIKGVDFYICNTDAQALQNSGVPNKIQLGVHLTEGLGAGADPSVGEQSALESCEDIAQMLDSNTKMVFITAGMGGGTGTGAAPVIAKMAKDLDILTVGIVTMPFQFEGRRRVEQSKKGVEKLRNVVDSLIVINNNKLREVYGNLGFKAGFSKADEVLSTAARGIAEVITHHYTQNVDLRDAKTVLTNSGTAIMGSAIAAGQTRAQDAISKALDSPLLNDNKITGAKNVLLLIVSGSHEITIDEIGEINDHIQSEAGHGAEIIMGVGEDNALEESIAVTIIATGFNVEQQNEISNTETKKIVHALEETELKINSETLSQTLESPLPSKEDTPIVRHTLDLEEEPTDHFQSLHSEETTPLATSLETTTPEIATETKIISETIDPPHTPTEEEFVITAINSEAPITDERQTTLTFDLPITTESDASLQHPYNPIDCPIKETPTTDHVEAPPATPVSNDPVEIRYALDDYNETFEGASSFKNETISPIDNPEVIDTDIVFDKKITSTDDTLQPEVSAPVKADPMNTPISQLLKDRAEERKQKMKAFNYKFNSTKIDSIEKIPAYKRQGVDLEQPPQNDLNISRTSIGVDSNDDIQVRRNNSFLHDNVD